MTPYRVIWVKLFREHAEFVHKPCSGDDPKMTPFWTLFGVVGDTPNEVVGSTTTVPCVLVHTSYDGMYACYHHLMY